MKNKCDCGTGHFGYHEVSCAIHKGYAPDQTEPPSLSDTECQNVGYVRCEFCDSAFSENSGVELGTLDHTDSISRFKKAWFDCPACGHKNLSYIFPDQDREATISISVAKLQALHDKIKELEWDKERLDWLDGNRSDIFGVSVASFDVWLIRKTSGDIAAQGTIRNAIDKARKQQGNP